ncbi:alpha/beta hydrolase [Echinicola sp. CAU 1574]|uniref:Alpha/beta hydrolase n=1 Tax=Echinicola arenosa TaxID=2774144 RepID=A0ABR9AK78_9BACT|nr:alpha/beta hydrolase-fold protein [Echinicola arenosa]MBD8489115.1 alpha/beta hydrolase [Echinicola arenosa]
MKATNKLTIIPLLICFLFLSTSGWAQLQTIQFDSLYSTYLKEVRQIQVIFPKQNDPDSKDSLNVFYVLDGEWNTSLSETALDFLKYAQFVPTNTMIVSIPNKYKNEINRRERDFTPTQVKDYNESGGANNFLLILKKELVPYINEKYPTQKENNVLYGTSWGGLFAIYTYLHEPLLFKSYLTVEPVLKWDNGYINRIASEKLENIMSAKNTIWISSRDGKDFERMGIAEFDSLLTLKAPKELQWKVVTYPDETHFSTIWKGLYDGLKFIYKE